MDIARIEEAIQMRNMYAVTVALDVADGNSPEPDDLDALRQWQERVDDLRLADMSENQA